jgi:hypothetical protein
VFLLVLIIVTGPGRVKKTDEDERKNKTLSVSRCRIADKDIYVHMIEGRKRQMPGQSLLLLIISSFLSHKQIIYTLFINK